MLVYKSKEIVRFAWLTQAMRYGIQHCRGINEWYEIIDTQEDIVVYKWSY